MCFVRCVRQSVFFSNALVALTNGLEKHPQQRTHLIHEKGPAAQPHYSQEKHWTLSEMKKEHFTSSDLFISKQAFKLYSECNKIRKYYILLTNTKYKLFLEINKQLRASQRSFKLNELCLQDKNIKEGNQGIGG